MRIKWKYCTYVYTYVMDRRQLISNWIHLIKNHGTFLCADYFALSLAMPTVVKQRVKGFPFPPYPVNWRTHASRINSNEQTDWIQIELVRWLSQRMNMHKRCMYAGYFNTFNYTLLTFQKEALHFACKIFFHKYQHIIERGYGKKCFILHVPYFPFLKVTQ